MTVVVEPIDMDRGDDSTSATGDRRDPNRPTPLLPLFFVGGVLRSTARRLRPCPSSRRCYRWVERRLGIGPTIDDGTNFIGLGPAPDSILMTGMQVPGKNAFEVAAQAPSDGSGARSRLESVRGWCRTLARTALETLPSRSGSDSE